MKTIANEDAEGKGLKPLYVHDINPHSAVNGPGRRVVVWVQGCSLSCPGCFNPETHSRIHETVYENPQQLGRELGQLSVDGLTVSGGEPLEQADAVSALIEGFRQTNGGTVLLFTGFAADRILRLKQATQAILRADAVLAGPYIAGANDADIWQGKRLLLITDRITPRELEPVRQWEIQLNGNGRITMSGYPEPSQRASILHTARKESVHHE
ncbi:MAG: radical protein [Paenibacillus sp.]|nr:radical protein [Paenibacillus sp.]